MRKIYNSFFLLTTALLLAGCGGQSGTDFNLSVNLVLPQPVQAKLLYLGEAKATVVDSVLLDKGNMFSLSGELEYPSLFTLRISGMEDIYLIINPKDDMIIDIDNSIRSNAYTITGSTDSRLVNEVMTMNRRVRNAITELSINYENSKNNPETYEVQKIKFDSIYDNLLNDHKTFTIDFIASNPNSLACIFALYQDFGVQKSQPLFDAFEDIAIFNSVDSSLTAIYPQTEAVIALNKDVTELKEQIKHKRFSEKLITPGKKAPDFEVKTLDGTKLSLEQMEPEPIVYVFFALWNEESVKQVLDINDKVKKYPFRRLKVIGISFDTSPEKLAQFIDENGISFPVVSDFKYWDSPYVKQFGVRQIPDILLLDPNHIVHKRNLSSNELFQTLSEWKRNTR